MQKVDPITLEIVRGFFVTTVLQMRITLMRTAYAPILYDTLDFNCGLINSDGELVAMSEDFSGHVFAMALGLKAVVAKYKGKINPGDVFAVNDPYTGGTHLNDIAFYSPFFADGKILLFLGVRAHHADVGGATPGSFSGQDTEIYQEGVRILPVKLIARGRRNEELWDVLFSNMRLTEERIGDALAMLDTLKVAEMRMAELCNKYGATQVREAMNVILDSSEKKMRDQISRLPSGDYIFEHYMDCSGLSPEPLPIKAKLTIQDDTMTFDFTGTCPQVAGPMNCGIPVSEGGVFVIVKSWLDPKTPINAGTFRPLKFIIPEGSVLGAKLPAPVGGCWEVYRQVQATVVGLFSQVIPHDLGAENLGTSNHVYVGGYDPHRSRPYIFYEYPHGGSPATNDTDGVSGSVFYDDGDKPMVNPVESAEQRHPVLIEGMEIRTNGEGAGYRRSGFGVTRRVRILSDTSQLNVMADRAVIPPFGTAGGFPGGPNGVTVVRAGQELQPSSIPGKVKSFPLKTGDVVIMQASAGGGVGDPLEREPERVVSDVVMGFITPKRAQDLYGVVIEDGSVDLDRTDGLRGQLRQQRHYFKLIGSPTDDFDRRGCRLCRLSRQAAAALGVRDGELVEYVSKTTAPLRAWVKLADGLPGDSVPLGPVGCKMLKLAAGDLVWLRPVRTNL